MATGTSARADSGACPCVQVLLNGVQEDLVSAQQVLDAYDLHNDNGIPYETNGPGNGGPTSNPTPMDALSIDTFIRQFVHIPPSGVSFVAVRAKAGAHTTYLDSAKGDFEVPTPFKNALEPGLFLTGINTFTFVRPMRDASDKNYLDVWDTDRGGTMIMEVYTTGHPVTVSIHASATSTKVGSPVTLTAQVQGSPPPGATYDWDFGDGHTGSGQTVTHAWTGQGDFPVNLTVTSSVDHSEGTASPVYVQVGPKPKPIGGHLPGSGAHHHPHRIQAHGRQHGQGHNTIGAAKSSSGTGSGSAGGSAGTAASQGNQVVPGNHTSGHRQPAHGPRRATGPDDRGSTVSGTLLTRALTYVAPARIAHARQASAAQAVPKTPFPVVVLGLLGVLAALGAGALSQHVRVASRLPVPAWRRW